MRLQGIITKMLVLAGVPLCIGLIMLLVAQSKSDGTTQSMNNQSINNQSNETDTAGRIVMLDPQGDAELAGFIHPRAAPSTTVQIILSRKVSGYELPCLGFTGFPGLESRVAETFGLVVFGGELYPDWPIMQAAVFPAPYIAYIYDLHYGATTAASGAEWSSLRAAFGGSEWPKGCPMYVSPDGQPSLAELNHTFLAPPRRDANNQDIHISQIADGWKVTVVQARAQGDTISFDYTVTGPRLRYKVDPPIFSVEGKSLQASFSKGFSNELDFMGPGVGSVSFRGLTEAAEPQQITVHFVVPAIHIRPPIYPCEGPGAPPTENLPPPTAIQGKFTITPVPDVKTVGPFAFDLKVLVQPRPTEPPVPSPVPTPLGMQVPSPQPTGKP